MTLYNVVKKLIGSIEPYGDSSIDEVRNVNLEEHSDITYNLIEDLIKTASFKDRHECSIRIMGVKAYSELLELKEMIDCAIEQGK